MREEIDQAYLGFVHLAQAFGPVMRMRGATASTAPSRGETSCRSTRSQIAGFRRVFGFPSGMPVLVAFAFAPSCGQAA